jgi:thioredoxin reductase (NADPH)
MNRNQRFTLFSVLLLVSGLGYCFGRRELKTVDKFAITNVLKKQNVAPVLVIGSGPAGLMAATYGSRGGKDTFLIEGNKPGGLLMDTTEVANWPGETMIQGPEIIEKLREQAVHQNVNIISDQVERIDTASWPYAVHLESGDIIHAMTIVVATGASPRKLEVSGEEQYWGSGVTSCAVCDAPFFRNEEVVVVGGGDSAVEEAIQLSPFASKITILVRKDQMRAAQSMQDRLKDYPKISVLYNVEIKKVVGDLENVTGVELYNNQTKKSDLFATSGVFLAVGHIPNSGFVKNAVTTDQEGYIKVYNDRRATSTPGIFAAGDIADRIYRQAGTSAGSGIEAGLDAVQFLDDHGYSNQIAAQIQSQLYNSNTVRSQAELLEIGSMTELQELISNNPEKTVVVDFWTETCSSCKQMLPSFKQAASDFADDMLFVSVDADEADDIADTYRVMKVPTLIALKNGQERDRHTGFLSNQELSEYLQKMLLVG